MKRPTHPQLVAALAKPPEVLLAALTPFVADLWHAATGVAGEGGELLEGIVEHAADYAKLRENVVEELGDIEFYLEQLFQRLGVARIQTHARDAVISPDMLVTHGMNAAIWSSKVLDTVKKSAIYNKPLDTALLRMQVKGLDYCMDAVRLTMGIRLSEVLNGNIDKLLVRYKGMSYSDSAAQARADKPGGAALSGSPTPPLQEPNTEARHG